MISSDFFLHIMDHVSILRFLETRCEKCESNHPLVRNSSILPLKGRHTQFYFVTSQGKEDWLHSFGSRKFRGWDRANWTPGIGPCGIFLIFFYLPRKPRRISASLGSVGQCGRVPLRRSKLATAIRVAPFTAPSQSFKHICIERRLDNPA